MPNRLRFLLIDDCKDVLMTYTKLLEQSGHEVMSLTSCDTAIDVIREEQPHCVVCDLMMPGLGGLELFKIVRDADDIKQPVFAIVSGKQFEYDKRRAHELGVDAYLTKPINTQTFVKDLESLIKEKIAIKFWGCRGTLPVAGERSLKYGGNTNCIEVNIANKHNFIFDAGTGIKELSNFIMRHNKVPYVGKIFLTHPHYDHINGIPFFVPLYMKGNDFEFFGPDQGTVTLEQWLGMQMDSLFFPVTMKEFSSSVSFHSLTEETIDIDGVQVHTLYLNHPGHCLGYRIEYKDKSFCYITDNELYLKEDKQRYNKEEVERLISFINDTDVLIIDATYTDDEYKFKIGWGHSPLSNVVDVADRAKVKLLCLHHHDPDQCDEDIDHKLRLAQKMLKDRNSATRVVAPHEGEIIEILR